MKRQKKRKGKSPRSIIKQNEHLFYIPIITKKQWNSL